MGLVVATKEEAESTAVLPVDGESAAVTRYADAAVLVVALEAAAIALPPLAGPAELAAPAAHAVVMRRQSTAPIPPRLAGAAVSPPLTFASVPSRPETLLPASFCL